MKLRLKNKTKIKLKKEEFNVTWLLHLVKNTRGFNSPKKTSN